LKPPGKTGDAGGSLVAAAGSESAVRRVVVHRPPGSARILADVYITVAQQVEDIEVDAELSEPSETETLLQPEVEIRYAVVPTGTQSFHVNIIRGGPHHIDIVGVSPFPGNVDANTPLPWRS